MAEGPRRGPSALLILFLERSHQHLTKARLGRSAHTRTSLGDALHPKARPAGLRSIWTRTLGGGRSDRGDVGEPGGEAERICLVGALPREVAVVASKVAVRGCLRVDRPLEIEIAEDRARPQVEVL